MSILKIILTTIILTVNFSTYAQEIIISQTSLGGPGFGGNIGTGQSFIAPADYDMTAIAVRPYSAVTTTLYIFDNASASGAPIYTQTGVNLVSSPPPGPLQMITLDDTVPISAGQSYAFVFDGGTPGQVFYTANDVYADGAVLYKDSTSYTEQSSYDLAFQIYGTSSPAVAAPKAIPSLSVFGLLSLMMLVVGWTIRRKVN